MTIEEKFEEYIKANCPFSEITPWIEVINNERKKDFLAGAKEQEEIDHPIMEEAVLRAVEKERKLVIDKACKILDERVAISGNRFDKHEDFMNDFRKRMEG